MELHTSESQARRYVHRPRNRSEPYGTRMELAKEAAKAGYGWEDLMRKPYYLCERDARHIVFGDHR